MARFPWWAIPLVLLPAIAGLAHAEVVGDTVWIPMREAGADGDRTIRLEATLYMPPGQGPFPVVIFHHGSSGGPIPPHSTEKARGLGEHLAARGIATLVPMRRGRGRSEGSNGEEPSACTPDAARRGLQYASEAVDATYDYLERQPWAAMDKIVLAGHSRGGMLAAVYAARHPGRSAGVINFSGGWKDDRCGPVDVNLPLFEEAASRTTVPVLFLYARGDAFYGDDAIRRYAGAYRSMAAGFTFKLLDVQGINGHQLFHRAMPLWQDSVDAFLDRLSPARPAERPETR